MSNKRSILSPSQKKELMVMYQHDKTKIKILEKRIKELEQQLKTSRNDTLAEAVKAVYGLPVWEDIDAAIHVIKGLKE
jgi:allophanate hydrolase subunit 1